MNHSMARVVIMAAVTLAVAASDVRFEAAEQSAEINESSSDAAALHAVWATLDAAWNQREPEKFSRLFSENAEFFGLKTPLVGRSAIYQHFAEQFPQYAAHARHATRVGATHPIAADVMLVDAHVDILGPGPAGAAELVPLQQFVVFAAMLRTPEGWRIRWLRVSQLPSIKR